MYLFIKGINYNIFTLISETLNQSFSTTFTKLKDIKKEVTVMTPY